MYLVAIAWLYVALMAALGEATSTQGSVLGAVFTFVFYGLLPLAIVLYVMGSPQRRTARLRKELQERDAWLAQQTSETAETSATAPHDAGAAADTRPSAQGDGRDHAAAVAVAPERKET